MGKNQRHVKCFWFKVLQVLHRKSAPDILCVNFTCTGDLVFHETEHKTPIWLLGPVHTVRFVTAIYFCSQWVA